MSESGIRQHMRSLLFGMVMIAGSASAQVDLDSLRSITNDTSKPDSVRFTAYYDLVWDGYLFSDPDTAQTMARWLQTAARKKGQPVFVARASELLAATWYVRGELRTALLHYDTALALHKSNHDEDGYADVITNMASMRSALGERDEALRLYAEGLVVHERLRDSMSIANDLNAIGAVLMARGDHVRATDLFMRSLHIQELIGNDRGISTGRANMGSILIQQGDHAQALPHYREALRIAEKLGDQHLIGKDLEDMGACLEALGDTAAAMEHFQRSLRIREELEDKHGTVNAQNRIAALLFARGRLRPAMELFEKSAAMAKEEELPWGLGNALLGQGKVLFEMHRNADALAVSEKAEIAARASEEPALQRDVSELRFNVLKAMGRWEEALQAQSRTVMLNDSLVRETNQREVLRNEYRYAYEKQAYADSLNHLLVAEKEADRAADRMSQERWKRNVALALGGLLAVIVLALWQRARLLRRTNATILETQAKLVVSERQREAAEVRTRIARDVHDQLGSDLTKLVMLSGEVKALAREDPSGTVRSADDIERVAGEANRSLGDIVWAIDPHHDSLAGLTERVRAHCERMLKWSYVAHTINCAHEGPDRTLGPAVKRDIYLILREALNNAIKYSKATRIDVRFRTSAASLEFEVKDNGVGLPADNNSGHGLANMRHRASACGAELTVESRAGEGTRVRLSMTLS